MFGTYAVYKYQYLWEFHISEISAICLGRTQGLLAKKDIFEVAPVYAYSRPRVCLFASKLCMQSSWEFHISEISAICLCVVRIDSCHIALTFRPILSAFLYIYIRWCACSIHEQWGKWNRILFKIILASHADPCSCSCVFCDSECNTLERLSPRFLMAHLLCPAALQFALSSVPLYKWDCINNMYVSLCFHVLLAPSTITYIFHILSGVVMKIVSVKGVALSLHVQEIIFSQSKVLLSSMCGKR